MIDHNHKIVFVHIPRTGGSVLCNKYYENFYKDRLSFEDYTYKYINRDGKHTCLESYQTNYDLYEYTIFSIIRNPWDRIYSAYQVLIKTRYIDCSFEEWLDDFSFDSTPARRLEWSIDDYLDPIQDVNLQIFKHEDKDTPEKINDLLNLKDPLYSIDYIKTYRDKYTAYTKDLVNDIFQEDIERFEYEY